MKKHNSVKITLKLAVLGGVVACSSVTDFKSRPAQTTSSEERESDALSVELNGQRSDQENSTQNSTIQSASTNPSPIATNTAQVSKSETGSETKPILVEKQEYSTGSTGTLDRPKQETQENKDKEDEEDEQGKQTSENTEADRPIPITGGFLTCTKADGLFCAIDIQAGVKFPFIVQPMAQISVEINNTSILVPVTATYQPITSRWHWKIDQTGLEIAQVTKVMVRLGPATGGRIYQTTFLLTPQRIGDGTNNGTQGGCSLQTFSTSVNGGLTFNKTFILNKPIQDLRITIVRLCGVVRANEGLVRLFRGTLLVGSTFLPITVGENDFSVRFKDLPPGDYRIELVPGNKVDIDDFMFYDLRVSY